MFFYKLIQRFKGQPLQHKVRELYFLPFYMDMKYSNLYNVIQNTLIWKNLM